MIKAAYAAHRIDRDKLRPLGKSVIVSDMNFEERISTGGIIIMTDNGKSTGIRPRWGQVYAVGAKQTDVQVGQWVLIAHGRWTRGMLVEKDSVKEEVRMVDEKDILLVSDVEPLEEITKHAGYNNS